MMILEVLGKLCLFWVKWEKSRRLGRPLGGQDEGPAREKGGAGLPSQARRFVLMPVRRPVFKARAPMYMVSGAVGFGGYCLEFRVLELRV